MRRREKNAAYSLRSFARDLTLSPSMLSEVMNAKKTLSRKSAVKIQSALRLSPPELERFLLSVESELENPFQTDERARERLQVNEELGKTLHLRDDQFSVISDPRHYVLFALFGVKNFKFSLMWISKIMGGFQFQIREICKRLQRLGVIRMNSNGDAELQSEAIMSSDGIPSEALRQYHRATLARAADCIAEVPVNERDFHSYIFAIDQEDFSSIQQEVRDFHNQIYLKYGRKPTANRVYGLQSQFVPYTQRSDQ